MEQVSTVLPFLSFLTVTAVAAVPLAAGIYLVTSSTWGSWSELPCAGW